MLVGGRGVAVVDLRVMWSIKFDSQQNVPLKKTYVLSIALNFTNSTLIEASESNRGT
jgi:hypothetical protein